MAKIRGQFPAGPPLYAAVAQLDERARPKRQAARSSRAGGASERGSANGRPRRFERRYRGSNPCPRTREKLKIENEELKMTEPLFSILNSQFGEPL
jgi:hypothetical protein